jgi:hypothetical protein
VDILLILGSYAFGQWVLSKMERSISYAFRRFLALALSTAVVGCVAYLCVTHTLYLKYTLAGYYLASAVAFMLLLGGNTGAAARLYRIHDYLVGHTLFFLLGLLSVLQVRGVMPFSLGSSFLFPIPFFSSKAVLSLLSLLSLDLCLYCRSCP